MNPRDSGLRRIRIATRGLATVGVLGSIAFAGLARAATEPAAPAPGPAPSPSTTAGRPGTRPPAKPPANQPPARPAPGPAITVTDDPPFVTSGGS
jgi:hypothetical protein